MLLVRRVIHWAVNRSTSRGSGSITQPRLLLFLDVLLSFTSGVIYGVGSGGARAAVAGVVAAVSATRLSRPCFPARFALYDPGAVNGVCDIIILRENQHAPFLPLGRSLLRLRCHAEVHVRRPHRRLERRRGAST